MDMAMQTKSANLWHRRVGHISRRSLNVLNKVEDKGVNHGDIQACDVCAIGKSTQQAHPKEATDDFTALFHTLRRRTLDTFGSSAPGLLFILKRKQEARPPDLGRATL